ncbi:hypothetical protein [Amycolatopsis sp. lyj-84]|uniref:hypothetical protein n=1 Tax=Amycolatopsis sp. lyj-84 TaxID=2789284 RepID=UPI00397E493F
MSVISRGTSGVSTLITKGAPEAVLERCVGVPPEARAALDAEVAAGTTYGRPSIAAAATASSAGEYFPQA